MTPLVISFIRAGLIYLAIGVTLGFTILTGPFHERFEEAIEATSGEAEHTESIFVTKAENKIHTAFYFWQLYGFVAMIIFGVSYHILPRFSGRELYSEKLAWIHFALANLGVVGMTVFKLLQSFSGAEIYGTLVWLFAMVTAVGIYIYIFNLWRSVRVPPAITAV